MYRSTKEYSNKIYFVFFKFYCIFYMFLKFIPISEILKLKKKTKKGEQRAAGVWPTASASWPGPAMKTA
jgi:hypothetical protein